MDNWTNVGLGSIITISTIFCEVLANKLFIIEFFIYVVIFSLLMQVLPSGFPDDPRTTATNSKKETRRPAGTRSVANGPTVKFGRPANLKMFLVAPAAAAADRGGTSGNTAAEPQVPPVFMQIGTSNHVAPAVL